MTVGKQPGRQIIVYDKRREAIERQKHFWFDVWKTDRHDRATQIWRVEVRAGKHELKDKYRIRAFEDFDASIGDVIVNALRNIRYVADGQTDSNVSRQALHPLWVSAQEAASQSLSGLRSGLTPHQIIEAVQSEMIARYSGLLIGNGIGLGVSLGKTDDEITGDLASLIAGHVGKVVKENADRLSKSIDRTRKRLHFVSIER